MVPGKGKKVLLKLHLSSPTLTWWQAATGKWVPNISLVTNTDGNMIPDPAVGIDPTEARAGVLTLSVDAGSVSGTVVVDLTLRPAVGRRSQHLRQAVTLTPGSHHSGRFAVWSTGVGIAGVLYHHRLH